MAKEDIWINMIKKLYTFVLQTTNSILIISQ